MEKYLLDTHAILWYFQGNENLPKKIRTIIESKSCFYSIISFWEIAIKQKLGKLDSSFSIQELESMCTKANIQIAPITSKSIETTKFLPLIHRDPFDRLLIAQAKNLNLILITKDMFIPQYDVKTLWSNSPRNFLFSKPLQGLGIRLADCDGCRRVLGHIVRHGGRRG